MPRYRILAADGHVYGEVDAHTAAEAAAAILRTRDHHAHRLGPVERAVEIVVRCDSEDLDQRFRVRGHVVYDVQPLAKPPTESGEE